MDLLQPYVVKRHRIEGNKNYIKLTFESFIVHSEKYLHDSVRKSSEKHPYPPRLKSFLKYMYDQCENTLSGMIYPIQVYSVEEPSKLDNYYLTLRYFTTGLKYVEEGQKHYITNHTVNMHLYIYKCRQNINKYREHANCFKVLINEALIRCDFELLAVNDGLELSEKSLYFFYTVSHSCFTTGLSCEKSAPEFDAASVCEVQIISDTGIRNSGGTQINSGTRSGNAQINSGTGSDNSSNAQINSGTRSGNAQINSGTRRDNSGNAQINSGNTQINSGTRSDNSSNAQKSDIPGETLNQSNCEFSTSSIRRSSSDSSIREISFSPTNDIQELQKRIDYLLENCEGLLDNSERLRECNEQLTKRNEGLENTVEQLTKRNEGLENTVEQLTKRNEELKNTVEQLQTQLEVKDRKINLVISSVESILCDE